MSPAMILRSVVLPHPLGPSTTMVWPSGMVRFKFWMENVEPRLPSLSVLQTSISSIVAMPLSPGPSDGSKALDERG